MWVRAKLIPEIREIIGYQGNKDQVSVRVKETMWLSKEKGQCAC